MTIDARDERHDEIAPLAPVGVFGGDDPLDQRQALDIGMAYLYAIRAGESLIEEARCHAEGLMAARPAAPRTGPMRAAPEPPAGAPPAGRVPAREMRRAEGPAFHPAAAAKQWMRDRVAETWLPSLLAVFAALVVAAGTIVVLSSIG